MKELSKNRKAYHDYEILETFTAGIVLHGWEVKSILGGGCSIGEGFVIVKDNEIFLKQTHINAYKNMDKFSECNETRDRKLLLNKSEIRKLKKKIEEKGLAVIPVIMFYSETRKIKLTIAVGRGKKNYDKRQSLKTKQHERDMQRENK